MDNNDSGYRLIVGAMKFFRGALGAFVLAIVVASVGSLEVFEVLAGAAGFGGHFPQPVNTMLSLAMTGALVGMMAAAIRKDWRFVAFFAVPYIADLVIDAHGADVWMKGAVLPLFGAPPEVQAMRAVFFMLSAVGDIMAGYVVVNGWNDMTKIVLASFGYDKAIGQKTPQAARPSTGRPSPTAPSYSRHSFSSDQRCVVCEGEASVNVAGRYYCYRHVPARNDYK